MDIQKIKQDLLRDEGIRLKPYLDTKGKLTIGIGRNLNDVGITAAEADLLLTNDIVTAIQSLDMAIPYWKNLSEARQRALLNMCFNVGIHNLLGFKKMLEAIRLGDFKKASEEALDSAWAQQTGARAYRISSLLSNG